MTVPPWTGSGRMTVLATVAGVGSPPDSGSCGRLIIDTGGVSPVGGEGRVAREEPSPTGPIVPPWRSMALTGLACERGRGGSGDGSALG